MSLVSQRGASRNNSGGYQIRLLSAPFARRLADTREYHLPKSRLLRYTLYSRGVCKNLTARNLPYLSYLTLAFTIHLAARSICRAGSGAHAVSGTGGLGRDRLIHLRTMFGVVCAIKTRSTTAG